MTCARWSRCSRTSATPTIGPMLVHVVTKKGKGYAPAENCRRQISRRGQVRRRLGRPGQGRGAARRATPASSPRRWAREMARDDKVVAITAAMPSGTGLDKVAEQFPERTFDVGIAEQHAVTFAAGLAAQGYGRSRRSIRPSSSAPTTRSSTTSRSRICRCASRWTAPGWSAPTARRTPGAFDLAYLCTLPNFVGDGGGRRGRALPHGPHHGAARQRADRGALSARRGQGRAAARRAAGARDRQGPHRPRGQDGRDPVARHAARGSREGRRRARGARGCRRPSPTCASPSRSTAS